MRMLVVLTSLIFLLPAVVAAQDEAAPRATIFGGYSYLRNSGSSSFNGWEGQGTFNFSRHFGITADINGNYSTLASFSLLPGVSVTSIQCVYIYLVGSTDTTSV